MDGFKYLTSELIEEIDELLGWKEWVELFQPDFTKEKYEAGIGRFDYFELLKDLDKWLKSEEPSFSKWLFKEYQEDYTLTGG